MAEPQQGDETKPQRPSWLAHLASWLSGALLVAVLGVIGWDAVHADAPAQPVASPGRPRQVRQMVHVPVTVRNDGDVAAKDVVVRVTLVTGVRTVADEITVDWVPGHSRRLVTVILPFAGALSNVTAEIEGFVDP